MGLSDEQRKKALDSLESEMISLFSVPQVNLSPYSQLDIRVLDAMLSAPRPVTIRKDPVPVSEDKPKITTSGANGFSEKGAPDDWDMAVGEIYGYRWWQLYIPARLAGFLDAPVTYNINEHLSGVNQQFWDAGHNEAKCTAYTFSRPGIVHEPPEVRARCGCGYWAYFDKELDVALHFPHLSTTYPYRVGSYVVLPVFGVIKGTGRVIIGEKGFRSQYAEIIGLCLPEIAKAQLSWWTKDINEVHARRIYKGSAADTVFKAFTGDLTATGGVRTTVDQCSDSEQIARVATVECILSGTYPRVRIFSDQQALTGYFPPDVNYAPKPDQGQDG